MIRVKTFYMANDLANFSYLIFDEETADAWAIDPYDSAPFIDYIKKNSLRLQGIFNTHQHFDHIRGNQALMEAFGVRPKNGQLNFSQGQVLEVLDTPGHTLDHQAFLLKPTQGPWRLFAGDTLFNAGVGNCKGGGDTNLLYQAILKLKNLPQDTLLYPGHDYLMRNLKFAQSVEGENRLILNRINELDFADPANRDPMSLAQEREVNPFLRLDSEDIRKTLFGKDFSVDDKAVFLKLRAQRDQW